MQRPTHAGNLLRRARGPPARRAMTPMQTWDPHRYARHARFVFDLGEPVVDLLDPQPGERVLDLRTAATRREEPLE